MEIVRESKVKPRQKYRQDLESGEVDRLYRFDTDIVVMTGAIHPETGIPISYRIPRVGRPTDSGPGI